MGRLHGTDGQVADSTLKAGGKVTGVIPEFMCAENEPYRPDWIDNYSHYARNAKKNAMLADAAVALRRSCGTLEELFEVITWKQLGIFTKPIIIVNVDGYYDPLIEMLHRAIDENFMRDLHRDIWKVVTTAEEVIPAIKSAPNLE